MNDKKPASPFPAPGPGFGGPPKAGYTENKPETDWILSQSTVFQNGLILKEGHLPAAPKGKALLMTVDEHPVTIAPGVYPGKVQFTVYTLSHVDEAQAEMSCGDFRTSLYVKDGKLVPTELEFTAGDYTVEENRISGATLCSTIDDLNGIIVAADHRPETPLVLEDWDLCRRGGGNSEGRGSGIMAVGESDVLVKNAFIWNYGTQTAIMASGNSRLEVADSVIYGARDFSAGKLCPWVLGINGSNRLTNAIDRAQVYYHDSIVVAQSWAALSTDSGSGVRLVGKKLFSGIGRLEPYVEAHRDDYTAVPELNGEKYGFYMGNSAIGECGYVNYADTGFHNSFEDVTFYSPDYIFILSTGKASIDVTGDSLCHSDRIGVMFHKNAGGTVSLTGGRFYAKDCLFMVKSYSDTDTDGCWCHTVCDGTQIELGKNGVLYQLMTSDDAGLFGPSGYVVTELEQDLSQVKRLPETYPAQKMEGFGPFRKPVFLLDGAEVTPEGDVNEFLAQHPTAEPVMYDAPYELHPTYAEFKNLTASGDIFNGVYQRIQVLDVTLDHANITGRISSAYTYHVDEKGEKCPAGTTYSKNGAEDEHLGIGRVGNTPAPAINNPLHLTLKNGASWTPTGVSYLGQLVWEEGTSIQGTVTHNGSSITAPGTYTGSIVVKP